MFDLLAVGDVMVKRNEPATIFDLAGPVIKQAGIAFANCESTYSETGARNPATRGEVRSPISNLDALTSAGFNVVSFANNHHLDAGYDAFFETIAQLKRRDIAVCGAGKDIDEARLPAILEQDGVRVAFLGYSSILFPGYEAAHGRPGCAPMRIHTVYEQVEIEQPGSVPRIRTFANPEDLAAMKEDIREAKKAADLVVMTPHWGIHFTPVALADYETEVAHAAIDAGADAVFGHHQHVLKGIRTYKGKAIFHGLGNFAMDVYMGQHAWSPALREMQERYPEHAVGHREETPTYPFHSDSRCTMMARLKISDRQIEEVSYIPCYINASGQPEPVRRGNPLFDKVADYVDAITTAAGIQTRFSRGDDEVIVHV